VLQKDARAPNRGTRAILQIDRDHKILPVYGQELAKLLLTTSEAVEASLGLEYRGSLRAIAEEAEPLSNIAEKHRDR
jgi:hypothetical protein